MDPNTMSWQHVTLLHDMAQKGFIDKAELLIKHGADLVQIDEAYQSTPLGLAARWGNLEMVIFLLDSGRLVNATRLGEEQGTQRGRTNSPLSWW